MRKQKCNECGSFQTIFIEEITKDGKKYKRYRCINCSKIFMIEVV
jgi:transposase-like protein